MKHSTVLITGASAGIGEACAHTFAEAGARLILWARRSQRISELASQLHEEHKTEVLTEVVDVRDREAVQRAVDALPDNWKDIDVLINNAGLSRGLSPLQEGSFHDWGEMIDTNIQGLQIDLNGTGVSVTNIDPGLVETEFSEVRFRGDTDRAKTVYKGYAPLTGRDVAEVALFAASRPPHVSIQDVLITPTDQATATMVNKKQ